MDAAALILRRCKVSPDTGGSGSPPRAEARKVEIQSKAPEIINAFAETTMHHYGILCHERGKKEL